MYTQDIWPLLLYNVFRFGPLHSHSLPETEHAPQVLTYTVFGRLVGLLTVVFSKPLGTSRH